MSKLFSVLFFLCCIVLLFSCQKEISKETGVDLVASGSLWDSSGACLPDSVYGTYYDGVTPGSDTAYVEVQVNVTQTGSYSIKSDLQNGFEFTDSGFFTSIGINTIRLRPLGAPILPVSTTFSIAFDSSFCSFSLNVQDSTGTGLGGQKDTTGTGTNVGSGNWQFATDSGGFSKGTFLVVIQQPDTSFGGIDLEMDGYNTSNDSVISMGIHFSNGVVTPGTYYTQIVGTDLFANAVWAYALVSTGNAVYDAIGNPGDGSNIGITVSSYDTLTHVITGTFSGIAVDEPYQPALIGIQNGSFTAMVP